MHMMSMNNICSILPVGNIVGNGDGRAYVRAKRSCRDVEMRSTKCNSSQDEVGVCTSWGSLLDTFATGQRLRYHAAVSSLVTPAAPGPCQLLGLPLLHEGTALRSSLSLQYSCVSLYISRLPPAFQCFHLYEC